MQFELSKIKAISPNVRDKWMNNPVIHDFVVLVYVYLNLIKSSGIKQHGITELQELFNVRMLQHKDYFEKNQTIKESYSFVAKIVNYFCNKYRK